jgi:pimeloyl-ACP methyl ester carboxylesterase
VLSQRLSPSINYAVIVLGGHDSAYDGRPAADPAVEQFSYTGRDARGRPLPYTARATNRSLESSADLLADQIDALHRRTHRPVALLGESEGAMVARTYFRNRPQSPVKALLMFSPLVHTGRTYYPPPGVNKGWGVAAGTELRAIFVIVNLVSGSRNSPDEPFVRSLLEQAPFYRFETLCPIPGVRVIAFLPTVSAAETTPGSYSNVPVFELPALHGGLLGKSVVNDQLTDFLAGMDINKPRSEYPLLQVLGAAWQAPTLAIILNPVWKPEVSHGLAFAHQRICQSR